MNYPDDFNTRTFPAGKSVAISRAMGIGIMSVFFIIVCLCGLIIWTLNSVRTEPYILATGGINNQWRVVMSGTERPTKKMTDAMLFQQSLIWKFTQNWFNVSADHNINHDIWDSECGQKPCPIDDIDAQKCALFCTSGDEIFHDFSETVLPQNKKYETANTTLVVVPESMRIEPIGHVSEAGGSWLIQATILIDGSSAMDIVAYAKVANKIKYFPATMGYYIADFNAYRVSQ